MRREDYPTLESTLNGLEAEQGLRYIASNFGNKARFSSALGIEDQIITHFIGKQSLNIEIFTLDTGRLFQESYDLLALTRQKYKIPVTVYFPETTKVQQLLLQKGPNSFYDSVENRKECCYIRKVEPLRRALTGAEIWITGIRGDQSGNRNQMQLLEWDEAHQVIKYNPLLHWSWEMAKEFVEKNNVPVSTLHKKGFPSIGCAPCTRAIAPGEDFRAGRWWWESSAKECGLHETKKNALN